MTATYREDFIEEDELYDDFNPYGLPILPRKYRGVAPRYRPKKKRKIRIQRGVAPHYRNPKRKTLGKAPVHILIPKHKAIELGKPRGMPLKKSSFKKITKTPIKKGISSKKMNATSAKVKALKKEVAEKDIADKTTVKKSSKAIIIVLAITTTVLTGYVIWQARKKK